MPVKEREEVLHGVTHKVDCGGECGNIYITVNYDNESGKPVEIFIRKGKSGSCQKALLDTIARMVSMLLRSGIGIEVVAKQMRSITCENSFWHNQKARHSCIDAISYLIEGSISENNRN